MPTPLVQPFNFLKEKFRNNPVSADELSILPLKYSLFNTFSLKHWQGDLFGGLTAAVVSLPMALAFGVASGAGPAAGLAQEEARARH